MELLTKVKYINFLKFHQKKEEEFIEDLAGVSKLKFIQEETEKI